MSELPGECISAIPEEQGCACKWIAEKSKAALQGLAKAGNAETQDKDKCPAAGQPGYDECSSAAASAAACEAWCCHGPDGKGPPIVTSAPATPLQPKTGPCGAWQWAPGDLLGNQGCWVGVDPSIQQLPHNENGNGPWVGAQGNLGGRSSGWGAGFLLVFCVAAVGYVTTFGYLNYRSGKRGWRQLMPHRHFWGELAGLVADGVHWTRGGGRRAHVSQHKSGSKGSGVADRNMLQRSNDAKLKKSSDKKGKKEKKAKSLQKAGGRTPLLPDPAEAPSQQLVPPAGTTAAGGGRWVHMPS
jgi:hypothetical protein